MFGVDFVECNGEQEVVDVVAAQMGVAVGGLHFKDAVAQFEDGNVEGAAAEIIDGDGSHFGAIEAVCQRCRGGLIDQAQHLKAGHAACVLGGLALRIVEVGGDGDDRLRDRARQRTARHCA